MVGGGSLKKRFLKNMIAYSLTKLINVLPDELAPDDHALSKLYLDAPENAHLRFLKSKFMLCEADEKCFNIVLIGPTGAGKSTLINNLFNLTVSETAGSSESVTREVKFYQGSFNIARQMRSVNVIDTLGRSDIVHFSNFCLLESYTYSVFDRSLFHSFNLKQQDQGDQGRSHGFRFRF